jgi:hypothetical protein
MFSPPHDAVAMVADSPVLTPPPRRGVQGAQLNLIFTPPK